MYFVANSHVLYMYMPQEFIFRNIQLIQFLKVAATSLNRLAQLHNLVPKQFLCSSDWFMSSEVGYIACCLISGLNEGMYSAFKANV